MLTLNFFTSKGYRVTSPFGKRIDPFTGKSVFHTGIDVVKKHQSPIYAFVEGKVTWAKMGVAGSGYGGYGNVCAIKDKNGYTHVYAHLDSISVKEGSYVTIGQEIGKQGTTGRSTGSHLHYEIRRYGWNTHVDVLKYLSNYLIQKVKDDIMETKTPNLGNVFITTKDVEFKGIIIDGVSYAPVRILAESLGKQVAWNEDTKSIKIT